MPRTVSTAKPFRCPTITAGMCAALRCTPCDDVKVTTSCYTEKVNYPIKEPVRMKEPAVCPK